MASSMTKMALERIAANKSFNIEKNIDEFTETNTSNLEVNQNIEQLLDENSIIDNLEIPQEDSEVKKKKQKKKSQEKKITESSSKKKLTEKR